MGKDYNQGIPEAGMTRLRRSGNWGLAALGGVLVVALAAAPAWAQSKNEKDINDIGHRGVGKGLDFYSMQKEIALGKMLASRVDATSRIIKDPVVNEYVNRLTQNLVRNSDAHVPFTVQVIDSPQINAMALPGGFLFVNSGLVLAADDEAELAAVLSHEIAHVAARNGTRNATKAEIVNYATLPLIFVAGPVGFLGRSLSGLAVPMTFLKFSRGAEREADFLGVQYMYKTGYDPEGMVSMFEKLAAMKKKEPGRIARAFETHPPTPDRIRATEHEIATLLPPRPEYIEDTSDFEHVKARLAMLEKEYHTDDMLHGGYHPSLRHPQGRNPQQNGHPTLERRPADQDGTN
ncbi:MAG: M48 family metallopeptidase [Terriglobales bacterium]